MGRKPAARPNKKGAKSTKPAPAKTRSQGASQSRARLGDKLDAWQAHHSTTAIESLLRLLGTPLQSLLTWLVVAIAIALPAALYVALNNVQNIGYSWQDSSQISVFVEKGARENAVRELSERLLEDDAVNAVDYITPDAALAEFRAHSGLGRVVDDLDDNPLPAVLLVQPAEQAVNPQALEALRTRIADQALVAEVRLDMQWVERLHQIMQLAGRGVLAFGLLLAMGVLLVIGNTIRLAIENRRDEILVVKLVGGTDAFVRRPFLYTGLWYGIGGGLLAVMLVAIGLWWLSSPVAHLADLYQSDFRLRGLGWIDSLQLVLLAGLLGLLGAWLAVARHLSQIEPR
nr:permease-like cell division protein FtsX [Marinimicrobium alkaliphilum]